MGDLPVNPSPWRIAGQAAPETVRRQIFAAMAARGYRWRPVESGLQIMRPEGDVAITVRDDRPEKVEAARAEARELIGEPLADEAHGG